MGLPGLAPPHIYNYFALSFWTFSSGPVDVALIWSEPLTYLGPTSYGSTTDEVQKALKKIYNDNGVKIMISAFGSTEHPTTAGYDPIECAKDLAQFVLDNNLDGVDVDW